MDSRLFHPFVIVAALAFAGSAAAAPGDVFEVTSARVNLRAGPSTQDAVVGQAVQGDRLVERRREGEWIEVRLREGADSPVWIHTSLVRRAAAPAAGGVDAPAAAGGSPLAQFRGAIDGLNQQSRQRGGVAYYEGVEETGPGTVRITVGKAWESVPAANRKSSIDTLADLWRLFVPAGQPATIVVAGVDGAEIERRARP